MPYFLQHFAKNWVPCTVLCKKVAYFRKCPTFCNIFLKIGSKPLSRGDARYFAQKIVAYFEEIDKFRQHGFFAQKEGDRQVLVVFPYFLQHFDRNWV